VITIRIGLTVTIRPNNKTAIWPTIWPRIQSE